ncbi:MAG: hypothetical protein ACJA0N_001492 [Pseudohongiellaceae bacterium]|jgi:hypothetical protein
MAAIFSHSMRADIGRIEKPGQRICTVGMLLRIDYFGSVTYIVELK